MSAKRPADSLETFSSNPSEKQHNSEEKKPWDRAYERNRARSAIYRLPDELLLVMCRILHELDKLYLLRQSCRLFRGLMASPEFAPAREMYALLGVYRDLQRNCPRWSTATARDSWNDIQVRHLYASGLPRWQEVRGLLQKDQGRQVAAHERWDVLMACGRCKEWHLGIFFSPAQRGVGDWKKRICVGCQAPDKPSLEARYLFIRDLFEKVGALRRFEQEGRRIAGPPQYPDCTCYNTQTDINRPVCLGRKCMFDFTGCLPGYGSVRYTWLTWSEERPSYWEAVGWPSSDMKQLPILGLLPE